jgi:RHS repeat-associated protein
MISRDRAHFWFTCLVALLFAVTTAQALIPRSPAHSRSVEFASLTDDRVAITSLITPPSSRSSRAWVRDRWIDFNLTDALPKRPPDALARHRYRYDAVGRLLQQAAYRSAAASSPLPGGEAARSAGEGISKPSRYRLHGGDAPTPSALAGSSSSKRSGGSTTRSGAWEALGDRAGGGGRTAGAQRIGRRFTYDRVGNLSEIEDHRGGHTRYDYDAIGRIQSAVTGRGAGKHALHEQFAFDPAHNLLPANAGNDERRMTSDAKQSSASSPVQGSSSSVTRASSSKPASTGLIKNNRLEVFEDKRYKYDVHGNLIEKKIASHTILAFDWDVEHQLRSATVTKHANDPKKKYTTVTEYRYDAFGRRISKTTRDEKEALLSATDFLWDGNRLLAETNVALPSPLRGEGARRAGEGDVSTPTISRTLAYLYEPDSFAPLAQVEFPTPAHPELVEGRAGEGVDNTDDELDPDDFASFKRKLDHQSDQKTKQFQENLKASQRERERAHEANRRIGDPERTQPLDEITQARVRQQLKALRANSHTTQTHTQEQSTNSINQRPNQTGHDVDKTINRKYSNSPSSPDVIGRSANALDAPYRYSREGGNPNRDIAASAATFTVRYYHCDHLGTPRELTNATGNLLWRAKYKAWGNTLAVEYGDDELVEQQFAALTNSPAHVEPVEPRGRGRATGAGEGERTSRTYASANDSRSGYANSSKQSADQPHQPLRFEGQYFDEETGLHYNRFRYYDPDCGRFVSQDPIGVWGGSNSYQYAPDPINWVDHTGLARCIKFLFGRKIYQDNSIFDAGKPDLSKIDWKALNSPSFDKLKGMLNSGATNVDLMKAGYSPFGLDGKQVNLHHVIGAEPGPMVELSGSTHQRLNGPLHGLIEDGRSFRNDPKKAGQYERFRKKYWKERAKDFCP